MVVDKVNRSPQPLRGNQLAAALSKSGVLKNDVPVVHGPPAPAPSIRGGGPREVEGRTLFVPAEIDESKVLPELREYLARLVAGERVSISAMTPSLPKHRRWSVTSRLKARGLISVKHGVDGGAFATSKLIDLARRDISADELRELTLEDPPPEEVVSTEATTTVVDIQDTAAVVASIRAWLMTNVERGVPLHIPHIGLGTNGNVYILVTRLRDAGIVERVGAGVGSYLNVPDHERVLNMSDDDLFLVLWPRGRKPGPKPKSQAVDEHESGENPDDQITPEMAQVLYPQETNEQPTTYEDPVAKLMDQLLTVLTRMDARFARLERELGLPPIEQDGK